MCRDNSFSRALVGGLLQPEATEGIRETARPRGAQEVTTEASLSRPRNVFLWETTRELTLGRKQLRALSSPIVVAREVAVWTGLGAWNVNAGCTGNGFSGAERSVRKRKSWYSESHARGGGEEQWSHNKTEETAVVRQRRRGWWRFLSAIFF